jgi:NTE family protein
MFNTIMGNNNAKLIDDQNKIISNLMEQNKILKNEHATYCYKNGHVCELNEDLEQDIKNIKINKNYKYLVLSGGGIKGICYCGALQILEKENILQNLTGFAGTSAGSLVAALLAIGYNSTEIKDIIYKLDFNTLIDDKTGIIRDTYNFFSDYGIAPGKTVNEVIGTLIENKTGNSNYTFKDLYTEKHINLVIVGTNLNTRKSIYFNHNNSIPIVDAIRISMGIPFLFEPIKYNDMYCVDGGLLNNYPLNVFDGLNPEIINEDFNFCKPNPHVLGLNIITKSDITDLKGGSHEISSLFEYCSSIIDTLMVENERRVMMPAFWLRTINITCPEYPSTNFNLNNKQKDELIEIGKKTLDQHFK